MYRRALKLNPRDAEVWFSIGNAQDMKEDTEGAVTSYKETIKVDRTFYQALVNLGNCYLRLN